MRIKKLLIKNLGRHRHLEETLDGAVIGLMGPNGAGKSTILKIIHFLFTGWTPAKETQESFIRKVDPTIEQLPTQGFAEIEFYAQGSVYRLSRKVGSPSSRKLCKLDENGNEIKSETFTRADEIQATLNDVLGVDKYAMDNAVFPEQGQLDKILFGSQAEREELLVKLLLLGHMQKVADVAAGKIKMLSAEIQDFSTLHDELQSSRNIAESELAASENTLMRTRNYESEINLFNEWTKLIDTINSSASIMHGNTNSVRGHDAGLTDTLNNISGELKHKFDSVSSLEAYISDVNANISKARLALSEKHTMVSRHTEYTSLIERLYNNKLELQKARVECPDEVSAEVISDLNARIKSQQDRLKYKQDLNQATEEGKKNRELADKLVAQVNSLTKSLEEIEIYMHGVSNEASLFKTITDTCKIALANQCSADCPVCGENVSHEKLKERFAVYDKKLAAATQQLKELQDRHTALSNSARITQHELTQRQTLLDFYIKQYKTNIALLKAGVDEDVTQLQSQLSSLTAQQAKRNELNGRIIKIAADYDYVNSIVNKFSEAEKKEFLLYDTNKLNDDIKFIEANLSILLNAFNIANDTNVKCNRFLAAIAADQTSIAFLTKIISDSRSKADELYTQFPLHLKTVVEDTNVNTIEFLREKNKAFTELQAKTKQLKAQADGVKKRLLEIENKIKLDEDKRTVITELQKIVSAFSRQGIPMAYVQHKFDSLVAMTQENLEIMDANFAIIPNSEKPVSLMFYRIDEPGQVLFDHDKLSGGQKVRLSIAFLLAVQQLVIPDLGFLVLDEPSTHLDEEARENLKELLINLGQQLEASDTQILVCDHAKELEPALVNLIQL
jgi:exonuclease SbcC